MTVPTIINPMGLDAGELEAAYNTPFGQDFVLRGVTYRKVVVLRRALRANETNRCSVGPCPLSRSDSMGRHVIGFDCMRPDAACGPWTPERIPSVVPVSVVPRLALKGYLV